MSLYEMLREIDVLGPVEKYLEQGKFEVDLERGKLYPKTSLLKPKPYLFTKTDPDRICALWTFFFNEFGLLHPGCLACWKVVGRMESLRQLMEMYKLQREMGLVSKCGCETRGYTKVGGLYSGYWYASLREEIGEAVKLKEKVKEAVKRLPGRVKVVLKRGCTEMEMAFGDSKGWDKLAEKFGWEKRVALLDAVFELKDRPELHEGRMKMEHTLIEPFVMRKWIEFAAENRDETYLDYVDAAFVKPSRTYTKEDFGSGNDNRQHEVAEEAGDTGREGITLV